MRFTAHDSKILRDDRGGKERVFEETEEGMKQGVLPGGAAGAGWSSRILRHEDTWTGTTIPVR